MIDWIVEGIGGCNDCWKTDDKHGCATYAYRSRITELELTGGTLVAPEPVYYSCDGGSGARYSNGNSAFWEHHSEATLETNGKQSICTKQ